MRMPQISPMIMATAKGFGAEIHPQTPFHCRLVWEIYSSDVLWDWDAGWSLGKCQAAASPRVAPSLWPRAKSKPSKRSRGFLALAGVAKRNQDK